MEVESLRRRSQTMMKYLVKGEETIFNPIKHYLISDKTVSFAGAEKEHPQMGGVVLLVKGEDVKKSFSKAIKSFKKDLKDLTKEF